MIKRTEIPVADEFYDENDLKKLEQISKSVIEHEIDPVYSQASIIALSLLSEKYREQQKEILSEVIEEKFNSEKFEWSQHSKMLDWGQFVLFPKWMNLKIKPFPLAWWRFLVTSMIFLSLIFQIANLMS